MKHPLKGAKMVLASGDPIEDLRFGSSKERALDGKSGEFNANDKKELIHAITGLMQAVSSGQVVDSQAVQMTAPEIKEARRELLASALNDDSGTQWTALGAGLARQINEQADREGFLRRVSQGQTLRQGEVPRIPMPQHDTIAVVATSAANVGYQTVRQRVFTPDEFEIQANVRVENLDIEQINGDLLEYAYNDGLQAIMVQEDRLWKMAADRTVGVVNDLEYIAGELTTKNLGNLRLAVSRWNLPVNTAIISNDYWSDIIGSNDFATFLDPITKYDLAMNGQVGTLVGLTLITDAFRQPNQKVLAPGEIYIISHPENHAAYSTRGGIRSTPTSGANQGNSTRGWFLSEPFSFLIANQRSVCKGKRI
jgi:hypothetical protein